MALSGIIPKAEAEKRSSSRTKKRKESPSTPAIEGIDNVLELVAREVGEEAFELFSRYLEPGKEKTFFTATTTRFNIDKIPSEKYNNIVNLKRINDIRRINKFFESVNARLSVNGIFIDSVETYIRRKARILRKSFFPLNWIHYTFDVIVTRVFPKLPVVKQIYFALTRGRNRVLSRAETYGRLYSCGFEILETKDIGDVQYFVAKKIIEPLFPNNPTYGPLIKLRRHGKDGRLFQVYKLRTMHAYSEYLQEYVYKMNDLQEGGKFKDDFRITTEGKIFRKFWLDELPMVFNLIRGDMKLIGVRPLSSHYFNLYTDELKEKRIKYKPGLIPPFYADMPTTLEEIMESEMKYLESYEKNPFRTDLKYFTKAWYNIIFRKARSK